jgi:hypothetical protein
VEGFLRARHDRCEVNVASLPSRLVLGGSELSRN